ncbi:MAG TPA: DUF2255 family protein [Streptosporangiaceae bacterium]
MTSWTTEELAAIGAAEELDLQSRRADGTLRDPVTMWVVRHGDGLYVRAVKGRAGWYRGTRTAGDGRISSAGVARDVAFAAAAADAGLNDALDAVYRDKYRSYPPSYTDSVVNDLARSSTIRLDPR